MQLLMDTLQIQKNEFLMLLLLVFETDLSLLIDTHYFLGRTTLWPFVWIFLLDKFLWNTHSIQREA